MDIVLVGHRTESTRRATTATIAGVITYYPARSSTRMDTNTYILHYCLCQGYCCISFPERCFNDCHKGYLASNMYA